MGDKPNFWVVEGDSLQSPQWGKTLDIKGIMSLQVLLHDAIL